ncbi:acetate--CoA ligase family protein [Nocardioides sp. SLBN-35]|uniref:acetate--CoA ligase family protein n=1 Tax=Nocardioides sp. SLBN-35 TaxID=2768445 RepID=UPI001152551B|nr:acetate--CoA ligase family protein [Nocardioides sp. SLBN-35]TQK69496.1 acyl-CoA synthetase (NDP forming) [Nocardioides sp. SLBN-35]
MVTRESVDALLNPRTFALIGASDKSTFSTLLHANLVAAGHEDRTFLVNPRRAEVHGRATYPTCAEARRRTGTVIDLVHVMVPAAAAADALRDAAAAGARAAVVLSSGWSETGPEGRARQDELVALAAELGIALLGPNVLGLVNVGAGIPAMALSDPPTEPGPVALVSQSGASCGAMKEFAAMAGVGLSHVLTVGNEAMVTVGHLVDALVDDDAVRAVAIFMESIKEPAVFAAAARRAAAAGKAVVVLKAGRSELAARSAASHTGALVGDDRVVDAMLADLAVIRVDTIEEMLVTAGIAAHTGPLERPGIGVVSISGGACDIVADLADAVGADLPELSAATTAALQERMPDFGHAHNPLDITGAAIIDPTLWTASVTAVGTDPSVGAVLAINSLPWREDGRPFYGQRFVDAIGAGAADAAVPVLYVTQTSQPVGPQVRAILSSGGIGHVVPGLRLAVDGVARVAQWSARRLLPRAEPGAPALAEVTSLVPGEPLSEAAARDLLLAAGVPAVPSWHVRSAEDAAKAAAESGTALAMKIVSADIGHKSDIGGVRLGVEPAAAATTYDDLVATCAAARPDARLDGVLMSPMRPPATELLVGVTRDEDWGLLLAVGLGGVLVEVLDDVALAPLPVDDAAVLRMLAGLRGGALLDGVRGRPAADRAAIAAAVARIGRLAEAMDAAHGTAFDGLEVNPLRVDGTTVEALDALVTWRSDGH